MNMTPTESLQCMYARRRMNKEFSKRMTPWENAYEHGCMCRIVYKYGGEREWNILRDRYTMEHGETWNDEHKVLYVLEAKPQTDGYRNGFAVDLVTMSICG